MQIDNFGFDPDEHRRIRASQGEQAALRYALRLAELGSVRAMIAVADHYDGAGDVDRSNEWIDLAEQASVDDDEVAPIFLSSAYERGLGRGDPESRRLKSLAALERVAATGNLVVLREVIRRYDKGLNGAPRDHVKRDYWAEFAQSIMRRSKT